jgi:hypothetical protein
MSVPSIRFARAQARLLADQLSVCARESSLALGFTEASLTAVNPARVATRSVRVSNPA